MYQIQRELPHPVPLGLFKVSFEWADIQAGTEGEPYQLSLENLLTVLKGDPDPLNPSKRITEVLPYEIITGTRSRTYCSILVISMDKIVFPLASSCSSLELERLFNDFEIKKEDYEQIIGGALA